MSRRVVPPLKRKTEIQWAILDDTILVIKKPKSLTWKQFMAILFHTFEDDYAMREVLKGFKYLQSKSGLDFSKLRLGG